MPGFLKNKAQRKLESQIGEINEVLQFERDKREFVNRPSDTQASRDFWLHEWYKKCERINEIINGGKKR